MRRSLRPPLVPLVCLTVLLNGCQTWARYDVPTGTAPSSGVANGRPVRVSMRDGTQLMMRGTRVIGIASSAMAPGIWVASPCRSRA